MKGVLTQKQYEVHFYEINYKKKALLTSIIDYFNDVATYQSEELGVGLEYMRKNSIAWVLYKWDINIIRYPEYGDKITVRTRPNSFKKFYGYRKFDVLDSDGNVLAYADSVWILVNTNVKKPIRIPKEDIEVYGLKKENDEVLKIGNIGKVENIDNLVEFKVRYSDIDTNGHVNNEKYAAWMIESVPLDIVLNYTLTNLKITYKKETKYGEKIKVVTQNNKQDGSLTFYHKIINDDKELTIGQTTWEKTQS